MNTIDTLHQLVIAYHKKIRKENGRKPVTKEQFNSLIAILGMKEYLEIVTRQQWQGDFMMEQQVSICDYNIKIIVDTQGDRNSVIVARAEFTTS